MLFTSFLKFQLCWFKGILFSSLVWSYQYVYLRETILLCLVYIQQGSVSKLLVWVKFLDSNSPPLLESIHFQHFYPILSMLRIPHTQLKPIVANLFCTHFINEKPTLFSYSLFFLSQCAFSFFNSMMFLSGFDTKWCRWSWGYAQYPSYRFITIN